MERGSFFALLCRLKKRNPTMAMTARPPIAPPITPPILEDVAGAGEATVVEDVAAAADVVAAVTYIVVVVVVPGKGPETTKS